MIMVDYEDVFHLSYWRATQRTLEGVPFLNAFYSNFLATSPEVSEKFSETNFDALMRMLSISLVHVAKYSSARRPDALLKVLAERHSQKDLDIRPDLYDHWMEALIETVKTYDPQYEDGTGEGWRRVLGPGVDYMKSRYATSSE
jgi:hemoglobin-like flavoprotein